MSLATLDLVCKRVFESACLDRRLEVAWHGGEPLTVPLSWYEDAFALMAERCPTTVRLEHLFQTNGLLLNANWARFFARTAAHRREEARNERPTPIVIEGGRTTSELSRATG